MANASLNSSCKEMRWPFTPQWTLGTQPLEACVARPVKESVKVEGQEYKASSFFSTDWWLSARSQSVQAKESCSSQVCSWEGSISKEAPLLWDNRDLQIQTALDRWGQKATLWRPSTKHMGWDSPMLRCSGLTTLQRDTLSRGTGRLSVPRQGAVTEGRWGKGAVKADDQNQAGLPNILGQGEQGAGRRPDYKRLYRLSSVKCHNLLLKSIILLFMSLELYLTCATQLLSTLPINI